MYGIVQLSSFKIKEKSLGRGLFIYSVSLLIGRK